MGRILAIAAACLLGAGLCATCNQPSIDAVVVYVSVDQHHAEPVLAEFEQRSGIQVQALYDVEAAKTTGLVNRLVAEGGNPQADVFWNGEFSQTVSLAKNGILAPYASPEREIIPAGLKDAGGYWAGTCGRARVLIINTDRLAPTEYPTRITDLLDERWPADQVGIARPLFGTSLTHAAALYAVWGPDAAREFYAAVRRRGVRVVDGNSVVRDLVERGELLWGLTDTDDAAAALARGAPVAMILPDQDPDGVGTLVAPTTVALIAGGPHPENGRQLVDFLLSADAESRLIESGWCQVPVHGPAPAAGSRSASSLVLIQASAEEIQGMLETASADLREIFLN